MGLEHQGIDEVPDLIVPSNTDTPQVRIGAGTALNLATQAVGLGTSFLVGVLVARTLGVQGKGVLSVILQVPAIVLMVLNLGVGTSNTYFVSRGELKPGVAAANSVMLAVIFGLLGAPVIYTLLVGRLAIVSDVPPLAVAGAILILPTGLLAAWLSGISVGIGNLALILRFAVASSATTLLGLGVLLSTGNNSPGGVVAISVSGTLVGILVFLWGLRRNLSPFRVDFSAIRSSTHFSAKAYVSDIAGQLHNRQDVLILGWLAGPLAVGLYSVSVSFAELTWYIPSALGSAIMAKGGRTSEASGVDYVSRASRVAIVFMIFTATVSLILVPFLVPLVYGTAFAPSMYAFFALLPGVLADGVTRILWNYQTTRGRIYWSQSLAATVLNVIAVLALVPLLGPVGAGIASTISYTAIGAFVVNRFCADTGAKYSDVLVPTAEDIRIITRTLRRLATRDGTVD